MGIVGNYLSAIRGEGARDTRLPQKAPPIGCPDQTLGSIWFFLTPVNLQSNDSYDSAFALHLSAQPQTQWRTSLVRVPLERQHFRSPDYPEPKPGERFG